MILKLCYCQEYIRTVSFWCSAAERTFAQRARTPTKHTRTCTWTQWPFSRQSCTWFPALRYNRHGLQLVPWRCYYGRKFKEGRPRVLAWGSEHVRDRICRLSKRERPFSLDWRGCRSSKVFFSSFWSRFRLSCLFWHPGRTSFASILKVRHTGEFARLPTTLTHPTSFRHLLSWSTSSRFFTFRSAFDNEV